MNEPTMIETPKRRRTPFFILGVLLFVLGPVIYAVQFNMDRLTAPWYAPVFATVGLLLLVISVARRPGGVRIFLTVLFALVCAFEWFMLLVATRTPAYVGPATVGAKIPAFATTLADGATFTDKSLEDGTASIVLFFRGRW